MPIITAITRRDIFELFNNGVVKDNFWALEEIRYSYNGRLEIIDFLKRLYDLQNMESLDSRVDNAEEDIRIHISNGDYSDNWIFADQRFELNGGRDEILLRFLCEIFHPEVRDEQKDWKLFLEKINELLHEDGFELYVSNYISGREVYGWRRYYAKSGIFTPFSMRNKSLIENKKIKLIIPNKTRYQLFKVLNEYDEVFLLTNETNYKYYKSVSELVLEDISKYYVPKHFVDGKYIEITKFGDFREGTKAFTVFDVIESFNRHITNKEKFEEEVNIIFKLNNINFELKDGEITCLDNKWLEIDDTIINKEVGIQDLLREAEELFNSKNYSYAVEKIWDAFERIKTYHYPILHKKKSAEKVIKDVSSGNESIRELFETEFQTLTYIGNNYRIRHHEKDKIDISDDLHYEYFYKRCLALISILLERI